MEEFYRDMISSLFVMFWMLIIIIIGIILNKR
jgi:hypothetical protein